MGLYERTCGTRAAALRPGAAAGCRSLRDRPRPKHSTTAGSCRPPILTGRNDAAGCCVRRAPFSIQSSKFRMPHSGRSLRSARRFGNELRASAGRRLRPAGRCATDFAGNHFNRNGHRLLTEACPQPSRRACTSGPAGRELQPSARGRLRAADRSAIDPDPSIPPRPAAAARRSLRDRPRPKTFHQSQQPRPTTAARRWLTASNRLRPACRRTLSREKRL